MHFWDAGRVFCLFPGGAGEGRDWSAERGPRIQSSPHQGSGGGGSSIYSCVGCWSSADAKKYCRRIGVIANRKTILYTAGHGKY